MSIVLMDAYRYSPPDLTSFTHTYGTNSENPTQSITAGRGLVMNFGTNPAAGDNLRALTKNKTVATTTYDLIARIRHSGLSFKHEMVGLCLGDGTKFITWQFANRGAAGDGRVLRMDRWTNTTTISSARLETNLLPDDLEWLKVSVVSGDPIDYFLSENGTDWIKLFSESQTGFLTYTEVGISLLVNRTSGALPVSGTQQASMSVLYFKDPDIVPPV